MLISALIVGRYQDLNHQATPYPLRDHLGIEAYTRLFPIYLHHRFLSLGTTTLG